MTDQQKPVILSLPKNIGEMSREEVDAWLDGAVPILQGEVTKERAE
jgi:hypothetical protein